MPSATPEQIGREAGRAIANAIADNVEAVILRVVDSLARVQAEQDKQRDEIKALSNRIEALTRETRGEAPPRVSLPPGR